MNILKRISCCCVLLLLTAIVFNTNLYVDATDLIATTSEDSAGIGDYSITLPTDAGEVYDVTLGLISQSSDGNYTTKSNEVYYVSVINADGSQNTELSAYYQFTGSWNNVHNLSESVVTITSVPAGSTVTVENILIVKEEYDAWGSPIWSNYAYTYMATTIANSNNIVLVESTEDLILLEVGGTVTQTASTQTDETSSFVRNTDDTLLSVHNELFGTSYTDYEGYDFLTHLLSTYNVISLDEINSTHIVGPIISQNIAERTADSESGEVHDKLAASDYSNGVPSYVGDFTIYDETNISVALNYIFDVNQNPYFTAPYFYSEVNGLEIVPTGETSNLLDYYLVEDYETKVLSSNNSGLTYTYQNDDFIDFDALTTALQNSSLYILENGNAEAYEETIRYEFDSGNGTVDGATITIKRDNEEDIIITATNGATYDGRGYYDFVSLATYYDEYGSTGHVRLTINMEESWTITSAVNLDEINLILPDDYDYYDNPYLDPTTINFSCEYINQTWYEFETDLDGDGIVEEVASYHSVMPYTLINGDEYDSNGSGENIEYGEVGNKIIWNMPNLVTDSETGENRLTVLYTSHNIAGHIIAPNAEFWNYDENGKWLGGNLNGTAIFKSFYSGIMEMHMWAYSGLAEQAVIFGVDALKTVNGETPEAEYTFILDIYEYEEDGSIPDGILNNNFPIYANSKIDTGQEGEAYFSSIAFDEAGTYSFIVKEDTSMDSATDNVTYDLTVYLIEITVGISDESDADTTIYEITETKKYKIVDSDGNTLNEKVLLEEVLDEMEFTFNNTTTEDGTVDLTLYKYCSTGHVLAGAKFYVTEMTSATDETRPSDGYFESIISDANGNILIQDLNKNTYYKIIEYESAYGHMLADGYWIAYIDSNGFLASITAMDGADDISDDLIIYNDPEESAYLDLTITKKNQMNSTIANVHFTLERVVIDSDGSPQVVVGGYSETYETDDDGTLEILHLEADYVYMLTETSTPVAHEEHTGYWLITVTGNPNQPSEDLTYTIVEYDESDNIVSTVSSDIIYNEKIEFKLPTTGGTGKEIFYIVGITLMLTSFVIYKTKKFKVKNKYY